MCISLGTKSVTFQSHLPLDVTLITLYRYNTVVGDWRLNLHFVTLTARLSRKWTPSAWCLLSCIRSHVRMVLVGQCLRASGDSDRPASHYRPYLASGKCSQTNVSFKRAHIGTYQDKLFVCLHTFSLNGFTTWNMALEFPQTMNVQWAL